MEQLLLYFGCIRHHIMAKIDGVRWIEREIPPMPLTLNCVTIHLSLDSRETILKYYHDILLPFIELSTLGFTQREMVGRTKTRTHTYASFKMAPLPMNSIDWNNTKGVFRQDMAFQILDILVQMHPNTYIRILSKCFPNANSESPPRITHIIKWAYFTTGSIVGLASLD